MNIDYIAIFAEDVESLAAFYRQALEFPLGEINAYGGVEGGGGALKLGIYPRSLLPKLLGDRADAVHPGSAILLSMTVGNLDATYDRLVAMGATILRSPTLMPWGQRLMFFTDPEGNLLEIVEARPLHPP